MGPFDWPEAHPPIDQVPADSAARAAPRSDDILGVLKCIEQLRPNRLWPLKRNHEWNCTTDRDTR
jgi:hypothetical protein